MRMRVGGRASSGDRSGLRRVAGGAVALGAAVALAACSNNVSRFEEPTSFRFNDRAAASGPSGYWNRSAPASVSYASTYEYRGGRNPADGSAPSYVPAAPDHQRRQSPEPYGYQTAGGGVSAQSRQGYGSEGPGGEGPVTYAEWQNTPRAGVTYPAAGGYDDGESSASGVGLTPVSTTAQNTYPPPQPY
jgi:hypothetical protein